MRSAIYRRRAALLRFAAPPLRKTGLAPAVFRLYERVLSLTERDGRDADATGLPVPPPYLRTVVYGIPSRESFLAGGRAATDSLSELFMSAGLDLREADAMLDFGCGCGRIARFWHDLAAVEVHGCDYNPPLVRWCESHLPHMTMTSNSLEPPTDYPDERFDAIYAISVFTHWPEPLQHAWLAELLRILRPGGRLLVTTHGQALTEGLLPQERESFDRGELVVRFDEDPGSNLCSAFHPEAWLRASLFRDVSIELFQPAGAPGLGSQDIWVLGKP